MPLVALENGKNKVFAWDIAERAPYYECTGCGRRLVFMDCREKIKYFRHYEKCNCDSEPETPEHVSGKQQVYETICNMRQMGDSVELEHNIDNLKADVYWHSPWSEVAIEIQATNYTIDIFEDKIYEYADKGLVIIYLFIGNSFLKKTRHNIYSLKEIEKRIFVKRDLPGIIYAGYLSSFGQVFVPDFQEKWARGGGECSHRFISMRSGEKRVSLEKFLTDAAYIKQPKIECKHKVTKHVFSSGKIKRYKEVCSKCGKFIKWLPNKEAIAFGYDL